MPPPIRRAILSLCVAFSTAACGDGTDQAAGKNQPPEPAQPAPSSTPDTIDPTPGDGEKPVVASSTGDLDNPGPNGEISKNGTEDDPAVPTPEEFDEVGSEPLEMPSGFIGTWFGYGDDGTMFLLTFTEDREATLLRRSFRGESEMAWEVRPSLSGGKVEFGQDDAYGAFLMPVSGAIQLSFKVSEQIPRTRVTLDKAKEPVTVLAARTYRQNPDLAVHSENATERFLESVKKGGRNWSSSAQLDKSKLLQNPVLPGEDFAIRPARDIPADLPGAGVKRSATFSLKCLRRPNREFTSKTFNIVAELHTPDTAQVVIEAGYLFNPALWEQDLHLQWRRAASAGEVRDVGDLYVYLTDSKDESKVISNILKITAVLTEQ